MKISPKLIKAYLDEYIIGQEDAKKQQLQLTNFPSHHFQTYRAENKVGKAKE